MTMAYPNFLSSSVANTVILYGQISDPARLWEVMNTDIESLEPLTSQHTVIKQNQDVIRLSSSGWMDFTFNERMTLTKSSDLYLLCREKIMRGVSNFDLPLRRFLETYLDFVWAQTENLQDEHRSSGAGSTLFSSEDWSFSGWLPLPQAHVLLPSAFDETRAQFAEVDVAFWGGHRLIAVCLEGVATPLPSKRQKRNYLFDNHPAIDVISIPRDRMAEGQFPADLFPLALTRYWDDLSYPHGPAPQKLVLQTPS